VIRMNSVRGMTMIGGVCAALLALAVCDTDDMAAVASV